MASTTSGLYNFSLDVDDIIEQAFEPLGGQYESGVEASKARRVLNLVLIQLQNKGIPLSKLDTLTETLTSGTNHITLDNSVSDVLELSLVDGSVSTDPALPLERYSKKQFHKITQPDTDGRPTTWVTDRENDSLIVSFWPVPNQTYYSAKMLVAKKVEDVNASYQKVDLPTRYLPLLVKWLSYELSITRPNVDPNKIMLLKTAYEECLPDTLDEDRERADLVLVPGGISGR